MVKEQGADLDKVFAAVAHPIRRAMVQRLALGDCTVGELASEHAVTAPAISKHLRVLEDAGLLEQTADGRVRRCSLKAQPLSQAFGWLVQYQLFWTDALDRIAQQLEGGRSARSVPSKSAKPSPARPPRKTPRT